MSLPWRRIVLLILAFGLVAVPVSGARFASVMAEAEWHLEASVFECRLSHPINLYGAAVFSQRAGEEQSFYLYQSSRHLSEGEAELSAHDPVWREASGRKTLGRVAVTAGERPVQLDWRESQALMAELQAGKRLMFSRPAWYGDEAEVRVVMEPIGFRSALKAYQSCLSDLLPVNFDQVARTALYFPSGSDELPAQELRKLSQLALYVKADSRVTDVYVDGHTDAVGLRADNLALSQRRAEMVARYLTEQGLPEDKITLRWHGERYPVASNDQPGGRAENRRVTIRVDRLDDRLSVLSQP